MTPVLGRLPVTKDAAPRWLKDLANDGTRRYAMATAGQRRMPDFLIVGTKRGGTTSLWNYLVQHPNVEPLFPGVRGKKSTDYFFRNDDHDERWYRSHFPTERRRAAISAQTGGPAVAGEASPYYMWDPRLLETIQDALPHARILISLRDPVRRAWSHYQERVGEGLETLPFADALDAEEDRLAGELDRMMADPGYHSNAYDWYSYRSRGVYEPQVSRWLTAFGREQLFIARSEDFYSDQQSVMDQICDFLEIPRHQYQAFRRHNYIPTEPMPAGPRAALAEFYAPHNEALYKLLDRDLEWTG